MGLSVSVYKDLVLSNEDEGDFYVEQITPEWDWKIKNLVKGAWYKAGFYKEALDYAYSSHLKFRKELLKLIGRQKLIHPYTDDIVWGLIPKDMPFEPLINFADNEGVLDWEVCTTLYNTFVGYLPLATQSLDAYYLERYENWLLAFELAKDNGAIVFS